MRRGRAIRVAVLTAVSLAVLGSAGASDYHVRRDTVIPLRFTEDLSFKNTRVGDRIWARVDDPRDLPDGAWLQGRVAKMERPREGKSGFVEIRFQNLELPDRSRKELKAVLVQLDSKYVTRNGDGRLVVRRKEPDARKPVFGGMLAGLLLGKLLDKPFEGTVLGTLVGIAIAESERAEADKPVFVQKGALMGAMFESDLRFSWDDSRGERLPIGRDDEFDYRERDRRQAVPELEFDGRLVRFSECEAPYWEGRTAMFPLMESARELGLRVDFLTETGRYFIEGPGADAVLEPNSKTCRLNGVRRDLPAVVVERDGVVYVPAELLAVISNRSIRVNGTKIVD